MKKFYTAALFLSLTLAPMNHAQAGKAGAVGQMVGGAILTGVGFIPAIPGFFLGLDCFAGNTTMCKAGTALFGPFTSGQELYEKGEKAWQDASRQDRSSSKDRNRRRGQ